jgi:hypothetical protein
MEINFLSSVMSNIKILAFTYCTMRSMEKSMADA